MTTTKEAVEFTRDEMAPFIAKRWSKGVRGINIIKDDITVTSVLRAQAEYLMLTTQVMVEQARTLQTKIDESLATKSPLGQPKKVRLNGQILII